ncbi:MAG: sodium:proton antiporter [Phycisphaerae bacterium]|nr:sodium:proton antiporter [Phycisphaerae bacterium]MDW8261907.1 hypothetical protein [Phycisphaerales bacterium]
MRKVAIYSILLILGLVASQFLPALAGDQLPRLSLVILVLTMTALAFIMIHVGLEFEIDKQNLRQYGWDYVVAFTAASFPWIFCTAYFVFVMLPPEYWATWKAWKETLLAGRFAAPTSAGVLFSMLAAAGLAATWLFRKARILAIFDDLDTVLLMIPLKMAMIGLAWQLGLIAVVMIGLLWLAYRYLHVLPLPVSWPWVLGYSASIALVCEGIHLASKVINESVPLHLEVLLPAFVLGCMLKNPHAEAPQNAPHAGSDRGEQTASTIISAIFMVLVGLNMPPVFAPPAAASADLGEPPGAVTITAAQPPVSWGMMAFHVAMLTILSNLGKMFPVLCYRREAHWRERLAVAIGMWPRGEVGAGVLVISLAYGIGGPIVTAAMLSLSLNLLLTGLFILMVRRLLAGVPQPPVATTPADRSQQMTPVH